MGKLKDMITGDSLGSINPQARTMLTVGVVGFVVLVFLGLNSYTQMSTASSQRKDDEARRFLLQQLVEATVVSSRQNTAVLEKLAEVNREIRDTIIKSEQLGESTKNIVVHSADTITRHDERTAQSSLQVGIIHQKQVELLEELSRFLKQCLDRIEKASPTSSSLIYKPNGE